MMQPHSLKALWPCPRSFALLLSLLGPGWSLADEAAAPPEVQPPPVATPDDRQGAGNPAAGPVQAPAVAAPITDELQARLEQLSRQVQHQQLVLGLMQLGGATRTHQPFARELALVQLLGRDEARLHPALEQLAASAETGVGTVAELRDSFAVILLPKLQALEQSTDTGSPWSNQVRAWLSNAIVPPTVRSSSRDREGSLGLQLVNSALDRLTEDDLQGAVGLLVQLEGPAAGLTARWLTEAQARLQLEAAYESLSATILELLRRHPR